MDVGVVLRAVQDVAGGFAAGRRERQARDHLVREDIDELRRAGLMSVGLPVERGGLWENLPASARGICEIYRALAHGDSSIALVTSMHPAVLAFWLATPEVPEPDSAAWRAQRDLIFDSVEAGSWWGTITSEPGSGGDVARTKARARRGEGGGWLLSGQKHFGSGSGMTSFMLTTAVAEGEAEPDWFYLPVEGVPFDGSGGITLVAAWDGQGMRATQSHALEFSDCPAVRSAWPGHMSDLIGAAAPFFGTLFTAVILGVVETAVDLARTQLSAKASSLRPYEQVEWAQAEAEAWTIAQCYEGMLRSIEQGGSAGAVIRGKTMAAQLAESSLARICRVLGGGTFSQRSPFAHWFEDVRALGFLRPPWGLAFDGLIANSLEVPGGA